MIFPAFMRPAGILDSLASRLISDQRTTYSAQSARGQDGKLDRPCRHALALAQIHHEGADLAPGRRRTVLRRRSCSDLASRFSKCLRQRIGFSSRRNLFVIAQSRMDSIRPRKRVAVSDLVVQMGLSTLTTRAMVTARWTRDRPLISSAYLCCSNATVYANNHVILADAFHRTRPRSQHTLSPHFSSRLCCRVVFPK